MPTKYTNTHTQGNMVSQKENDSYLATKLKGTEYHNLPNKEAKIPVMNKFNVLQENSQPFNKLRNKSNEQEFFIKKMKL